MFMELTLHVGEVLERRSAELQRQQAGIGGDMAIVRHCVGGEREDFVCSPKKIFAASRNLRVKY